jgi:hypothetical protein
MIERVIENWLINSDERGYQIPFCQLLNLKNYKIVHVSTHGPFEQGKDIIALDSEGKPCAFQLKAGDISLDRWRKIRPEVEELLDIPINHPSIDKTIPHKAILVTNGTLSDPVRREIDDRNESRKRKAQTVLDVITRGELLSDFVSANEKFLPTGISDIQSFLNLYTYPGINALPKEKIFNYLSGIFPIGDKIDKKKLVIVAANYLLFSAYLFSAYESSKNYWSLADGWIITTAQLLAMAEKYNAYEELQPSIDLSLKAIDRALFNLQKEALESTDLFQGKSLFEGMVLPFRTTILAGYLTAYRLFLLLQGDKGWSDQKVIDFINKYRDDIKIFSEGSLPFFVSKFWYLDKTGQKESANKALAMILNSIIYANRKMKVGLISPYYEHETALRFFIGLLEDPITETFVDSSYSLDYVITLAARHDQRAFLASRWRPITHIQMIEFVPKYRWEYFLYRAEHGKLESRFPQQTQSWSKLVEDSHTISETDLPQGLIRYPQFLILLWLVYPHRMRSVFVKFLDDAIAKA